jgi:tetratricopeptide (TPR) repeat protein
MKQLLTILAVIISSTSFAQTTDDYVKSAIEKFNSNDFKGAIKDYTQAINVNGDSRDLYFNRGICEWALQDFESAKKDFDKTIQLDPKFAKAYYNRAIILISQQEFTQSLPDLDKTIELDKTSSSALMLRGEIRAQTGNKAGACEDFHKAKDNGDPQAEEYINENCGTSNAGEVYDSIVSEICNCTHTNQTQKASIIIDSCYELSIRNNYKALQKLGLDSTTHAGREKLNNEIMTNRFRLYCRDTYAKFSEEVEKEVEKNNIGKLTFTGRFISQTLNYKKEYYILILQSTQTKEKKEFHSDLSANENERNHDITVEYVVEKNKKTNQEELVVKSISSSW